MTKNNSERLEDRTYLPRSAPNRSAFYWGMEWLIVAAVLQSPVTALNWLGYLNGWPAAVVGIVSFFIVLGLAQVVQARARGMTKEEFDEYVQTSVTCRRESKATRELQSRYRALAGTLETHDEHYDPPMKYVGDTHVVEVRKRGDERE